MCLNRDLKPSNILLGEKGQVMLTYFCHLGYGDQELDWEAVDNIYAAPGIEFFYQMSYLLCTLKFFIVFQNSILGNCPAQFSMLQCMQCPCNLISVMFILFFLILNSVVFIYLAHILFQFLLSLPTES